MLVSVILTPALTQHSSSSDVTTAFMANGTVTYHTSKRGDMEHTGAYGRIFFDYKVRRQIRKYIIISS